MTRRLAAILGVPAIVSRYSRLLVDLNRGHDDPTLVMRLADGAVIPGNRHMDTAERNRRIDRYHEPYHRAADRMIDCCLAADVPPALLSKACTTRRAQSSSSGEGENRRLIASTWPGWMANLPTKPAWRAARHSSSSPAWLRMSV